MFDGTEPERSTGAREPSERPVAITAWLCAAVIILLLFHFAWGLI